MPGMLCRQQQIMQLILPVPGWWGTNRLTLRPGKLPDASQVLVMTGYGAETADALSSEMPSCPDLLAAAQLITAV
jgi:D-glycero-D-manno-heptose 1,7-bisphosphate phosphatase